MIKHRRSRFAILALALLAAPALAASVKVQTRPDYTRLLFGFSAPAKLSLGGGGNSLILTFDTPVDQSMLALQPQLVEVATGIQQSADKKQVIINLNKNYRVRQFVSGNTVGVDILSTISPPDQNIPVADIAPAAAPEEPKPTPKPVAVAEPAKPAAAPKVFRPAPREEAPPAPVAQARPQAKVIRPQEPPKTEAIREAPEPILTTKEVPPEPEPKPEPKATRAPKPEPVLTTKEEPKPEPVPEPIKIVEPEKPVPAATPEPVPAPEPVAEVEESEMTPEELAKQTPDIPAAEAGKNGPFLVGVQQKAEGTVIEFPWKQRTGAAVFERGNDIWMVFSREADTNPALLRTVMPREVSRLEQFAYKGSTVLRLSTDGSLHPRVLQPKDSYTWQVALSVTRPTATLDTPISAALDDVKNNVLQFDVYDAAPAVRFYDPVVGDLLLAVPTFELGRGVSSARELPEFSILPTPQGVAVVSRRDDARFESTRQGLRLMGDTALAVSENLPTLTPADSPVPGGASGTADVMMPHSQWYVPTPKFRDEETLRLQAIATAKPTQLAGAMERMVQLYLGAGLAAEAKGQLDLIEDQYPDYYKEHHLSLLRGASNVLLNHMDSAIEDIAAPELNSLDEVQLWRELMKLFAPRADAASKLQEEVRAEQAAQATPPPEATEEDPNQVAEEGLPPKAEPPAEFDFTKYNNKYIRFYPPRVRQRLAALAANQYIDHGQPDRALAIYDTLHADGILEPLSQQAEIALAMVAAKKEKPKEALKILDRIAVQQKDMYAHVRARLERVLLRRAEGMITPSQVTAEIERIRTIWRGDPLERHMLALLIDFYKEQKQYDNALRTMKYVVNNFPTDPDLLTLSGDMSELFADLFLDGLADDMPPLKSLALFYENRELTPIGERGNQIIQRLADRLAAVDLLDRATQLLEHQIKFRISGEMRSRVGARLALLHLLNKQPKRALEVMEITNFGNMDPTLRRQRLQITAKALDQTDKSEQALGLLFHDTSAEGTLLRMDILWHMQDWPNVINQGEDILAARTNLTEPLTTQETEVLLKLALAYSFEGELTQLRYLRDYYMGLVPDSRYKEIFDFITNDTTPLDAEDFALLAKQISRTESFLGTFREKIAQGKLSEAIQ